MSAEYNENSLVAAMDPLLLVGGLAAVCLIAYLCAGKYRDTNDFLKSVRLYAVVIVPVFVAFLLLGIPVLLGMGYVICGFVVMALISNHFFNGS